MVNAILLIDGAMLLICALLLILTSFKFFRSGEYRDLWVGVGLICISIALILGSVFNIYSLYENSYWFIVEIFHLIGAILITLGIVIIKPGVKKKK